MQFVSLTNTYLTYTFIMRKICFPLMLMYASFSVMADGSPASISSNPSPAVSNKPVEVTIRSYDFGQDVFCYSWAVVNGEDKPATSWDGANDAKYRMTSQQGVYTFTVEDIKNFYNLTDQELTCVSKLGFIAKNTTGGQTIDLFVDVVQGAREAYSGGEGTQASPFILKTAKDLKDFSTTASDWSADTYVRLDADIDAAGLTTSIGNTSTPFKGHFDGNGHTISNFTISSTKFGSATGLFGAIDGGTVEMLGVVGADVRGTTYTGILAGLVNNGTISRCYTAGAVTGSSICTGGLVGENQGGTITDCYSGASVTNTADYAIGGLVGKNSGMIGNAYAAGSVSGHDYVGGVVGANYGTIDYCAALNAMITSSNSYGARFGGNNNSENRSTGNFSWEAIEPGHSSWTTHGDHGAQKSNGELTDEATFRSLSGWDFANTWEWRKENGRNYPALKGMGGQECLLGDKFFNLTVGIHFTAEEGNNIVVEPCITEGPVTVTAHNGVAACMAYALSGALAYQTSFNGEQTVSLDLSGVQPGLYLLRVTTTNGTEGIIKIIRK